MAATSGSTGESRSALLESCLPLPLQDLCLLEVINDVDSYPVELLSSLPHWLRYRLLNNLPVLDLCRLEGSSIARGIDKNELWNSRWERPRIPHPLYQPPISNGIRSDLHYRIKDAGLLQDLDPRLVAAFQHLSNKDKIDAKQKYLLQVASDVLDSTEFETDVQALTIVPADWLISMKGDRLLQDLTEAKHNPHQARSRIAYINTSSIPRQAGGSARDYSDTYKFVWRSQTTALARYEQDDVRLAPHRLVPIRERSDPLELLSLLVHECGLQSLSVAHLGLTRMTNSKEWGVCVKESEKFNKILCHILHEGVILGLQCDHVMQPESILQTIMDAVFGADREKYQLQYLFSAHVTQEFMISLSPHFYVLPDSGVQPHYQGLSVIELGMSDLEPTLCISALLDQQPLLKAVQLNFDCGENGLEAHPNAVQLFSTLSLLFSRPRFQFLKLELKSECRIASPLLLELLCGFMRAPCADPKHLTITSESSDPTLLPQKEVELATVDVSSDGTFTVPESGTQHKDLSLSANLQSMLESLLQLSTIRVQSLYLDCSDDSYPYLHQGALHPDLQISSLVIRFALCPYNRLLSTVENDLVTFLKKPLLEEISLYGYWGMFDEIKAALVSALRQRADIGALRKLSLLMPPQPRLSDRNTRRYSKEQLSQLWKAMLELPDLERMELVIGGGVCDLILENEELVYEIWNETVPQTHFKLIKAVKYFGVEYNKDHKLLSEMTQTLVFTNKP